MNFNGFRKNCPAHTFNKNSDTHVCGLITGMTCAEINCITCYSLKYITEEITKLSKDGDVVEKTPIKIVYKTMELARELILNLTKFECGKTYCDDCPIHKIDKYKLLCQKEKTFSK